jgi:hypothetical protein
MHWPSYSVLRAAFPDLPPTVAMVTQPVATVFDDALLASLAKML